MLSYQCSVCERGFRSSAKWLRHLPRRRHQNSARKELSGWDADVRARVLVFVKLPVDKDVEIINQLSNHAQRVITDFVVTSEERLRIGLVRFETRAQLLGVIMSLGDKGERFYIDGSWCEMRDAGVITELEWQKYLPEDMTFGPNSENDSPTGGKPEQAHDPHPLLPPPAKRIKMEHLDQEEEETAFEEHGMSPIPITSSSEVELGLRHHLSFLLKFAEIPDEEYKPALDITRAMQQYLSKSSKKKDKGLPRLHAVLCRNWLLKLKYSPIKDLPNVGCAVHICADPIDSKCNSSNVGSFLTQETEALPYKSIKRKVDNSLGITMKTGDFITRHHFQPLDKTALPLTMSVLYKPTFLVETQVWRLLKYLCSFDTRCFPVLSLAYYWTNVNSISVGKSYRQGTSGCLANPSGLNWLVMFFFQSEGLIPDTRTVLERDHKPLHFIFDKHDVDLGFSDEDEYAASWRNGRNLSYDSSVVGQEKFAHDVFTLFREFLLFCGTQLGRSTAKHGWILNTRDCEIISMDEVLGGKVVNSKFLTSSHVTGISKNSEGYGIVMINPFFSNGRISTSNAGLAFEAMRKTGLKLKGYFDVGACVKRVRLELAKFLELIKI